MTWGGNAMILGPEAFTSEAELAQTLSGGLDRSQFGACVDGSAVV